MAQDKPHLQPTTVWRQGNVIRLLDLKHTGRVGNFISEMYKGIQEGHNSFIVELPNTEAAFPNASVPLAALIRHYRDAGLEVVVKHESEFRGISQIGDPIAAQPDAIASARRPFLSTIWEFCDEQMINTLVNEFVKIVSRQVECSPGVLQALEWCLNEVMDNVIQHSGNNCGFIAAQLHPRGHTVAICIADTGIGIYQSLCSSRYPITTAVEAIRLATKEGVTRDNTIGAGNGLWGLMQIVKSNRGALGITSGAGHLMIKEESETERERIPYPDKKHQCTFVDFQLDTSNAIDIGKALGGFQPVNLRLEALEVADGVHSLNVLKNAHGTGTRRSGAYLRNQICNLLNEGAGSVL